MPQTVPNNPTNGAVDPTVARKARPVCRRLLITSIARSSDIPTQELRSSCCLAKGGVILHRDLAFLRDEAERTVLAQSEDAVLDRAGAPELAVGLSRILQDARLLDQLDHADVPGADRHDDEDDQRPPGDEIALLPQRLDAVGVLDDFHRRRRYSRWRRFYHLDYRRWFDLRPGRRRALRRLRPCHAGPGGGPR